MKKHMKFGLKILKRDISILAEEFCHIERAHLGILEITAVEEKYDILLENMLELELELLRLAGTNLLFSPDEKHYANAKPLVNRRMINLLTASRLYLDHLDHHMSILFGHDSAQRAHLKKLRSVEYAGQFSYRFMEALRNYAQHRGYPVHELRHSTRAVSVEEERWQVRCAEHGVSLYIRPTTLISEGGFKPVVLAECKDSDYPIDVMYEARGYLRSLARIHAAVRAEMQSKLDECSAMVAKAVHRIASEPPVVLYALNDEGNFEKRLLLGLYEQLERLQAKNGKPLYRQDEYISSRYDSNPDSPARLSSREDDYWDDVNER